MKLNRREAVKLGLMGVGGLLLPFDSSKSALAQTISDCPECPRGEIPPPTFSQEELSHQIPRFQYPFKKPPLLKPIRSYENGERPLDCYEITMKKTPVDIIPGFKTKIWSYNGTLPGPVIRQRGGFRDEDQGRDSLVRIKRLDPAQAVTTRKFRFQRSSTQWLINNKSWNKNRVDANPQPGDIEIWELTNNGGWMHPVHIHFVDWQILDRNGRKPRAYERGWKDVFRVDHFETVRVIAEFGRRSGDYLQGRFMMHCHNLVHEDHSMMTQFEVGQNAPSPCSAPPLPISEITPL